MKKIDVFNFLCDKYPLSDAMDFDNPGFLVGERFDEVSGVLVALDCDVTAIDKAVSLGCNLIVSHHPVIFNPLTSVTEESIVYRLIKNGISVISMHTNLDVGTGGVNDCLCKAIGLKDIQSHVASDGYTLKKGTLSTVWADELAKHLHNSLNTTIKYVAGKKKIERLLVCGGSGANYVSELKAANCDALLTADVKHNFFIEAANQGFSLFDGGHFATEDTVIEPLVSLLRGQFPEMSVNSHHPEYIKFE